MCGMYAHVFRRKQSFDSVNSVAFPCTTKREPSVLLAQPRLASQVQKQSVLGNHEDWNKTRIFTL